MTTHEIELKALMLASCAKTSAVGSSTQDAAGELKATCGILGPVNPANGQARLTKPSQVFCPNGEKPDVS
jgi:hypothetical protein